MGGRHGRGNLADLDADLVLNERQRADAEEQAVRAQPTGLKVVAVIVVRDDGTCTVAWGQDWGTFDKLPGVWPNKREAMRTVERVVGNGISWRRADVDLWEGRI